MTQPGREQSGCACGTGHPVTLEVPMWPDVCVQRLMAEVKMLREQLSPPAGKASA